MNQRKTRPTPLYLLIFIAIQLFHFQLHKIRCAASSKSDDCPPSSCGKISEIQFPFRLKSDPEDCGDPRYELACENTTINNSNGTCFLYLFSGKYEVEAIHYDNYTIRLVDSSIQHQHQGKDSNCASIPDYTLYQYNFSSGMGDPYSPFRYEGMSYRITIPIMVVFWHCSQHIVDNPQFVNATPCSESNEGNPKELVYATPGLGSGDFKVGCHAKRVTLASWEFMDEYNKKHPGANKSYSTIGNALAYGFELSWLHGVCKYHCPSRSCYFDTNDSIRGLQCGELETCHYAFKTTDKCGFMSRFSGLAKSYLYGVVSGLYSILRPSVAEEVWAIEGGIITGRVILPSYLGARFIFGGLFLIALLIYRWRRRHLSAYENIENFLSHNTNLMPIRYSYKEIKTMTRGFKDRLGEGGFGCVYKGKLRSGPYVAIKILNKSKGNGQDFINEVATIGRIHHVNVVRLIGFCVEGSKRALAYEFMPNGSLDKHIFSGTTNLSCDKMYLISVGVAKGIDYLHQGCDMQILHFDIKPHNILLDENFVPKVSDFGLARLYAVDDSIVNVTARGTLGYMAPELYYKNIGGVSYKADVYSFGMLLMEMASRRKNLTTRTGYSSGDNLSQLYFPTWIHDQFTEGKDFEIEDIVDEEERNIARKMIMVALWCIQMNPQERPSMKKVVEMLEAGDHRSMAMPPRPTLYPQARQVVVMDSQKDSGDNLEDDYTSWETTSSSMSTQT